MDLRGHGESSVGWSDYSSAALGSDILALVAALGSGPAIVCGTSMGAGAAAWAAAEAPDRVAGLILIGPFVRDVPLPLAIRLLLPLIVRTAFVGPWAPAAWGAYYATLYPSREPDDFAAYKSRLVANLKEPGRMAALQAMLRTGKDDVAARLGDIKAPTLVVMGTKDFDFPDPAAEADWIAGRLDARVAMVDGVGHYPHAEVPERTTPVILDFLRGLKGG